MTPDDAATITRGINEAEKALINRMGYPPMLAEQTIALVRPLLVSTYQVLLEECERGRAGAAEVLAAEIAAHDRTRHELRLAQAETDRLYHEIPGD